MEETNYLLICLAEECAEVQHRIAKALRFGLDEIEPGQDYTNAERIEIETNDLYTVIGMLNSSGLTIRHRPEFMIAKRDKVTKFMEYSRKRGVLKCSSKH